MKDFSRIKVELPQYPQIARIIGRDQKRIYINTAADPGAKIDYLLAPGQQFVILGPNSPLPKGKPK